MTVGRSPIQAGMAVLGEDGRPVGRVEDVHDFDFILERTGQPAIYVPFLAVKDVTDDLVVLTVSADQVDNRGWAYVSTEP